jgi:large subunit ribosomal protein L20
MARASNGPASRRRRKRMLKYAKGYFGNKSKLFRYAKEAVHHAWQYAYDHRKKKKGDRRSLWIVRLNAACRAQGMSYSRFIEGLAAAKIELDRKVLSDLAIRDEVAFSGLIKQAQDALKAKASAPKVQPDDLVKIEGIGPKINELLVAADIVTFAQLAGTPVQRLKDILAAAGARFKAWDPTTWPEQAALAAKGDWAAFKKLTDELKGGRRV